MVGSEIVISADGVIRAAIILLYIVGGLASHRLLLPSLAPAYRRFAIALLVAQMLILALSASLQPSSKVEQWVWDVEGEWNIPATLATTVLAVVGTLALVSARFSKARPRWQRIYLVGTGLVYLYLAMDEYLSLHEYFHGLRTIYIVIGAVVAIATVSVAVRSPRQERIWPINLLIGFAMSGIGGIVLDKAGATCGGLGQLRLEGCLYYYPFEEALEYLGSWLALVSILGWLSLAAPNPRIMFRRALYALPGLVILLLFLYSLFPLLELRLVAIPAAVEFESGISLRGYRIDHLRGTTQVRLYASAKQADYMGLGYSIHLVDQVSGESVASRDEWAGRHHGYWLFGPDYMPLYLQWMEAATLPETPTNRALWVVLSLWRKHWTGDFRSQAVLDSDHPLLSETQVILAELVLPDISAATPDPLATFSNGFALVAAELPERAQAGTTLEVAFTWRSDAPGTEDHVQFLHLGHEESGEWWVYDKRPLGARLPTRLWYSGLVDSEVWQVPLPADLVPGRYNVFTGFVSDAR